MGIDTVDIGGAARAGVPNIPAVRNADGIDDDEGELFTKPITPTAELSDALRKSIAPGAQVAYPKTHPAVASGLEQDAGGAIIVPKGETATPKSVLTTPRELNTGMTREESTKQLDALLAAEDKPSPALVAKAVDGTELIEVIFHTEIGSIISYFHKVEISGDWLIMVTCNKEAAHSRFIPQPPREEGARPTVFDMSITGSDRKTMKIRAIPMGIQFVVDSYDFVIMMMDTGEYDE